MGDRASISFRKGNKESVVLFNHWGGFEFVKTAERYAKELIKERKGQVKPLDRFEPETVMVDFIRYLTQEMDRVTHNLYLGRNTSEGDNSDNGHYYIDFINGDVEINR